MRNQSAAQAKGSKYGAPCQIKPREGTRIRAIYDLFYSNKGAVVGQAMTVGETVAITQLRDFYGLDIRNIGYRRWVLAGEWFGPTYIDYIADRISKQERA